VFKLLSTTGDQTIDLAPGRAVIVGRAVTSDVPVYDPTISRQHAELVLADGGVRIKDLGSSNGTFLNGARITEAVATDSDVVTFGKVAYRVKAVSAPAPRPQVVPPFQTPKPGAAMGGTIVRQLPVSASGGVPAIVDATPSVSPSGASHLKVTAQSGRAAREEAVAAARDLEGASKQQELDRLLDKVVDFTFQIMNVDRVSILLLEPTTNELVPRISKSRSGSAGAGKHVPQSIAARRWKSASPSCPTTRPPTSASRASRS
jgi:adenylate cyclase